MEFLNTGKNKKQDMITPIKDVTDIVKAHQFNIEVDEQVGSFKSGKKVYTLELRNRIDLLQRENAHLQQQLAEKH